jgi:two-component system, LytTR family, sensor histidine kinase AlgZ
MHPLLTGRLRLALYLAAWCGVGALLGAVLAVFEPRTAAYHALFVAPLTLFFASACLSAWWVCRGNPPGPTPPGRMLAVIAAASLLASAIWVGLAVAWAAVLEHFAHLGPGRAAIARDAAVLGVAGVVLYAQSMAGHYVLLSLEAAQAVERRVLASQVAAREAELRALRAQLNPHFLFNSLNSISALAGSDPESARRMCQLLGEFLRASLGLGARERVKLAEELALAESYLSVEQVRFGPRLSFEKEVEGAAGECLVPPLLIQPLIENAVKHGIADRVEGGLVRVHARLRGGLLEVTVENPRDPAAPPRRGQGLGLQNVRQRLAALDPQFTRVEVLRGEHAFKVTLELPAASGPGGGPHVA